MKNSNAFHLHVVAAVADRFGRRPSRLSRRTRFQRVHAHSGQARSLRARTGKMPIFRLLASLLFVFGALASAQAKLNVVATLPDFGSLAREIGGDKVDVTVMAKPTEDPHFVDARPSFVVSMRSADVLIDGGALLPFKGQNVVAYHDSWPYFAHRFGLNIDIFLEPKPGIPPSPSHLVEVIAQMKAQKIKTIIVEPFHDRKIAEKVASATGAKVVDFSQFPGGLPGTDNYVKLIDTLVSRLAAALN